MKKSFNLFFGLLVIGMVIGYFGADASARITGYLYGDALVIGYPGTTVASISTAGVASFAGLANTSYLRAYSRTTDQLLAIVPAVGDMYYDSTMKHVVVATGTSAGNFANVDGGTW